MEDATVFDVTLVFHAGIVACFVVLGGFENFVIIFMLHKKKKLQSGQKFMLCLAYVDFFACVYCVPMIPVNIYLKGRSTAMEHLLILLYRITYSTMMQIYLYVAIIMALDRLHATSRPYSYKPPTMTSFLWLLPVVAIYEVVLYFCMIGWLPDIMLRIHGSAPCVLALMITIPSYTIVVYKVKKQGQKIAAPSSSGAPPTTGAVTMTANNRKCNVLPTAQEMPTRSAKLECDVGTSGHQRVTENRATAAAARKRKPKLETRMLKLCLGITCLFAVSYTALITRIALKLPHNLDYLYSLNHVGNPVIYCMISKAYRRDVFDTARLILSTIKKTMFRR